MINITNKICYPISVFCIIATEFCERFSFCGLRTILSLYLRNELLFSENTSTVVYHVFMMLCYTMPIAGALCADSFLGRYNTILYFSLIYFLGNILMCIAAIPVLDSSPILLSSIGLGLISIGTGGIKPCVAAFGGDQFRMPCQKQELQQFFLIFYFSLNLGSFIGMILTPVLRKNFVCFGSDTCYALGFGFPAILMFLSLVLFMSGKPYYCLKSPKENIMLPFIKCTMYAIRQKRKRKCQCVPKDHWLDYARNKYPDKLICDAKIVFAVLFLYTPLPLFWSLFDQQGSRWTFQASKMNGMVFGIQILPDQMQVINPAIVLILIPCFDRWLYPFFTRIHFLESPLHRMAVGGLIAGFAFLAAGILELILETTYPQLPDAHTASINVINTLPCSLSINNPFNKIQDLRPCEMHYFNKVAAFNTTNYELVVNAPNVCSDLNLKQLEFKIKVQAVEFQIENIMIGVNEEREMKSYTTNPLDLKKSLNGKPKLRIDYIKGSKLLHNNTVTLRINSSGNFRNVYFISENALDDLAVSEYMELTPGNYEYVVKSEAKKSSHKKTIQLRLGGVYTLVLREREGLVDFEKLYAVSPPNSVNILWLMPQYFLISVAEIMFGIAGLEFSFIQAPKSLKTVTIAAWYLSVAVGNLLVIIITQAQIFKSQAHEFFLFAMMIVADMMVFTEMASNYKIVPLEADSSNSIMDCGDNFPLLQAEENLNT